jgi:hypothetical protein
MSSENTPILAATIPAFELFISSWGSMMSDIDLEEENISEIISPGLAIAKKYYDKFDNTDAYIIAMCELIWLNVSFCTNSSGKVINLSIRLEWIKKNWSTADQEHAKQIILAKVSSLKPNFNAFADIILSSRHIETWMWKTRCPLQIVQLGLRAPATHPTLVVLARSPGPVLQRQHPQ